MGAETLFSFAEYAARELALFAAVGILLGGLDDLVIDILWFAGKRPPRRSLAMLRPPERPGRLAFFIPAWDEDEVIGPMVRHTLATLGSDDVTLFVGCYRNGGATIERVAEAAARDDRVKIALCRRRGPTTKADCLNAIWHRMRAEEERTGRHFKAVVLHDAEDVVHPDEARLFDRLIEEHHLVQIPVIPLIGKRRRWIAGHYGDEFAEAHGKDLAVRDALGAGVPSAGVGCAIRRDTLARIAAQRGDGPFDADSLTEDYELGLRLAASGAKGVFVSIVPEPGRPPIAVRAHFPERLGAAVRQKTRWITGIALLGWERLGWQGGIAERWMRLRDRRAVLAALVLTSAYAALALGVVLAIVSAVSPLAPAPLGATLESLLLANAVLLGWRLAMRALFTSRLYGGVEGLLAIPRALVSNIISIMAARRAVTGFLFAKRNAPPRWDKTRHIFPRTLIIP